MNKVALVLPARVVARLRGTSLALALLAAAPLLGCGEGSYDIYMRGLAQVQEAERGYCQMEMDTSGTAMVISSAKIIECLQANEAALETIKLAQEKGFTGKDVDITILKLEQKIATLEQRRSVVGYMERDAQLSN